MLQRTSLWDLGAAKHDWWPDWRASAVAIIASGPSAKQASAGMLRGRVKVLAIKENVDICPWADAVYGCDAPWWKSRRGLEEFKGLKLAYAPRLSSYPDIKLVSIKEKVHQILTDEPGVIGSGGNSGFQALNLAVQFGAKRIMLIGYDMHGRSGVHWYGRARGMGRYNPDESNFARWRAYFAAAAKPLIDAGVEVVNCSPNSELQWFRKISIKDILSEWRL